MASIPQFYSDDSFSSAEFSQFPYPVTATAVSGEFTNYGECTATVSGDTVSTGGAVPSATRPIWGTGENFPLASYDNVLAPDQYSDVVSPSPVMPFPGEQLGIWDSTVTTRADYNNNMAMCGTADIQSFGVRFQPASDVCEFGDDCFAFMHDLKPMYAAAGDNWGIQNNQMPSMEDTNVLKVGRYSVEERKDRILRYLKKKNQRNFNKTIKYASRKTLADRRVRVRGRFARNNKLCEEGMVMKNNESFHHEKNLYCAHDDVQIKQEEEWLQEAMASLMYLPYIAG